MRRIERVNLAMETANALQLFQEEADSQREQENLNPVVHWNGKRRSQPIIAVYATLKRMAGGAHGTNRTAPAAGIGRAERR